MKYKTVFELSQKCLIDQAIERGPFIDHSQSLNLYIDPPNFNKLASCHFYAWKNGLKTGMYYLRSRPAISGIKFGIDALIENKIRNKIIKKNDNDVNVETDKKYKKKYNCDDDICLMCSS